MTARLDEGGIRAVLDLVNADVAGSKASWISSAPEINCPERSVSTPPG